MRPDRARRSWGASLIRTKRRLIVAGLGMAALAAAPRAAIAANPIQHVIIIFMENRSFDNYFGTFPGANGIPNGVCLANNLGDSSQGCVAPFHDVHDYAIGGLHDANAAQYDLDDGITQNKMDGFNASQNLAFQALCTKSPKTLVCNNTSSGFTQHDAMGYHTADEIPNYWAYAQHFALQDALFASVRTWSEPSHVALTSEWMANCDNENMASTCRTANTMLQKNGLWPWVSLFQLMDMHSVTWKYYASSGTDPDCDDADMTCEPNNELAGAPTIWNPPGLFTYVHNQGKSYLAFHDPDASQFWTDVNGGTLPQVSWIVPNGNASDHPQGHGITLGMEFVTSLVNEVMQSKYWNSTAIFVTWDDWGGFYDNVTPPTLDFVDPLVNTRPDYAFVQGLGLRVPGLTISPWVKGGLIDHQVLSFDSYATFIEDQFMGGARLDPVAMVACRTAGLRCATRW